MAAFDFPTLLDDLKTGLETAVAGLYVRTVPADPAADPAEGVVFEDVTGTTDYHAMGHTYRTEYNVQGRVWAIAPEAGLETGAAARNRVATIWNALVGMLEDNTNAVYTNPLGLVPATWDYAPFARGDGTWGAQLTFTLESVELV